MRGKILIWLLAFVLLVPVSIVEAQQPKKFFRTGYLSSSTQAASPFSGAGRNSGW